MILPVCRLASVALLVLSLSACEAPSDAGKKTSAPPVAAPASASAAVAPKIVIETGSPDQAVKSWWRVFDLQEKLRLEECNRRKSQKSPIFVTYYPKILQEDALRTLLAEDVRCDIFSTYEREIQEVKAESETRAIVFAKIKNVTPVPAGAVPDEHDKKNRENGYRFKYLVEKSSEGWKVSQVYRYEKMNVEYLNKDPWEPVYKFDDSPLYPSFVWRQ